MRPARPSSTHLRQRELHVRPQVAVHEHEGARRDGYGGDARREQVGVEGAHGHRHVQQRVHGQYARPCTRLERKGHPQRRNLMAARHARLRLCAAGGQPDSVHQQPRTSLCKLSSAFPGQQQSAGSLHRRPNRRGAHICK